VDIGFIANGTHILADIIIIDPIHANLVARSAFSLGMAALQFKQKLHHIVINTLKMISSF
jgi:hypothetical protein